MQRPPRLGPIHSVVGLVLAAVLVWSALRPSEAGAQQRPDDPASINPTEWMDLEEALQQSQELARPVFVYVHASWCAPCHRLEHVVFPYLEAELSGVVTAAVDLSEPLHPGFRDDTREWTRANGLDTPPAFALVTANGKVVASMRGYQTVLQLRRFLSLGDDLAIGQ